MPSRLGESVETFGGPERVPWHLLVTPHCSTTSSSRLESLDTLFSTRTFAPLSLLYVLKEQWYLLHNYPVVSRLRPVSCDRPDAYGGGSGEGDSEESESESTLAPLWIDGLAVPRDLVILRAPTDKTDLVAFWYLDDAADVCCQGDVDIGGRSRSPFIRAPFETSRIVDSEGEMVLPRDIGAWFQVGEELQLAQVGRLEALPMPARSLRRRSSSERGSVVSGGGGGGTSSCCLFRRRLIVRRLLPMARRSSQSILAQYQSVEILHFKTQWKKGSHVSSVPTMLHAVETFASTSAAASGPSAVVCGNGIRRSGLFVAAHLLVQRLARDRFVDLFHTIRALKAKRHDIVSSVSELRFLYRLLAAWVDESKVRSATRRSGSHKSPHQLYPNVLEGSKDASTSAVFTSSYASIEMSRSGVKKINGMAEEDDEEKGYEGESAELVRSVPVLYSYYSDELSRLMGRADRRRLSDPFLV